MKVTAVVLLLLCLVPAVVEAQEGERVLFNFERSDAASRWQPVNDGVMGGRSNGRFLINDRKDMEFFGTLSLANNGGFASVRSRGTSLNLKRGDTIVVRFRGDGREYSLNLYTAGRRTAFSYRAFFKTEPGQWMVAKFPLTIFRATSFGRVVSNQSLNPSQVSGIGFLLGDKKPGSFKLEVASIGVIDSSTQ